MTNDLYRKLFDGIALHLKLTDFFILKENEKLNNINDI